MNSSEETWNSATPDAKILARAIRSITEGDVNGPRGIESLVMALTGDQISGRESLPRQISNSLDGIANAINNLADAYRERTHKLG